MRNLLLVALLFAGCAQRVAETRAAPAPAPAPATPAATARLCADGWEPIDELGCLFVPSGVGKDTPLVLYLHGMYPPDAPQQAHAQERRLAAQAEGLGVAVLAPRGLPGLCDWSPEFSHWLCWPTAQRQLPRVQEILDRLAPQLRHTSARLGRSSMSPVVVGYSNGGFFATVIASHTRLPVSGYAILHGGGVEPMLFPEERMAPVLLVAAEDDAAQAPRMKALHARLDEAGWPHEFGIRPGGHALSDEDLVRALTFAGRLKQADAR